MHGVEEYLENRPSLKAAGQGADVTPVETVESLAPNPSSATIMDDSVTDNILRKKA